MTDQQAIEAIVAFFAPLVVSLIKQTGWPSSLNGIVAIGVYVLFGIGAVLSQSQNLTLDNIVPAVTTFTTVGTVAYMAFWKNTGLQTAITDSTSIVKPPVAALPDREYVSGYLPAPDAPIPPES